jgi:hypothetical protein
MHWLKDLKTAIGLPNCIDGVFLAAMGADETEIEASFSEAIRTAKGRSRYHCATRGEATYAEYRRQKASASGRYGFRLPL